MLADMRSNRFETEDGHSSDIDIQFCDTVFVLSRISRNNSLRAFSFVIAGIILISFQINNFLCIFL